MINDEGFTVDKGIIDTIEILKDLNLMLDYMRNNGSRFLIAIMAENKLTKENEVLLNTNLISEDLIKIGDEFEEIVKNVVKNNECDCDKCKKNIELLRNKYKFLEE